MTSPGFALDPRLQADTRHITSLPLCEVLLMNDARYPWLILVPRRAGLVEIFDLPADTHVTLWEEISQAASALRAVCSCDKLNVGALGNIVRQLHIHIVARRENDTAWPGPVWGYGPAEPYQADDLATRLLQLRKELTLPIKTHESRLVP